MPVALSKERFHALDLLRGFFIVTIICDHLSRWPSVFGVLSGKGLLWITAAEGFVIISGLLVGYIRGFKGQRFELKDISLKLWRRALVLYLWAVIGSVVYTVAIWYLPLAGGAPGMPIAQGDWGHLLFESISLNYTFVWVYFLKLYAIFLAFSPLAIWLLRKGRAWIAGLLSLAVLALGWVTHNEILQWQFIFFIPVIAGFYIPAIQSWWQRHSHTTRFTIASTVLGTTIVTIILSMIGTFHPSLSHLLDSATVSLFAKDSISLFRAGVAFLWFVAYLLVFNYFEKYIQRWFGWLLMPIGTHSLTAYILHGAAIIVISFFFTSSTNIVANSILGAIAILLVWACLKIPHINRVIPR